MNVWRTERARAGFSFTGTALAVGVVLIVVNVLVVIVININEETSIRDREEVFGVVRAQLEEVLGWSEFATLVTQFDGKPFPIGDLVGVGTSSKLPGLVVVDDSNPNLLRVIVKAEWAGATGEDYFELSSYITNPDVTLGPKR